MTIPASLPDLNGVLLPVTRIKSDLFPLGGYSMKTLTIPASVTEIDPGFSGPEATELTAYLIENGNPNYSSRDGVIYADGGATLFAYLRHKGGPFVIPDNVKKIGASAFKANASLTALEIPAGVETIGSGAFSSANALAKVTFAADSQLKVIENNSFYSAGKLADITLPDGLTELGESAFASTALTGLSISASVSSIGKNLLKGCNKIASVALACETVPEGFLSGCSGLNSLARLDGVTDERPYDPETWDAPYLAWAEEKALLPEGFDPDALIARETLAYLVAGYLGGAKSVTVSTYLDQADISAKCLTSVQYLQSLCVMNGTGDGFFSPHRLLTRSELAAVLRRLVLVRSA